MALHMVRGSVHSEQVGIAGTTGAPVGDVDSRRRKHLGRFRRTRASRALPGVDRTDASPSRATAPS